MNSIAHDLVKFLVSEKKYDVITEYAQTNFPNKKSPIVVTEYAGKDIRVYKSSGDVHVLCPMNMTPTQESALTDALEKGTIFDDAETVDRSAKYIELTTLPHRGICNAGKQTPQKLHLVISLVIGRMDDTGRCEVNDTDIKNGCNLVRDIIHHNDTNHDTREIVDDYLENKDHMSIPKPVRTDIGALNDEIDSIDDVEADNTIDDDDYEYLDVNGDSSEESDDHYEEGFITKRPKKLKPIPRDIIAYITVEMNAIQDSNDQAMLSGYTCSKLELVDFYLNVIDTKDDRYIVPHTREYLVNMQTELNKLLTQILRIRPVNKNDRVWKVNYPDGWRG